MKNRSATVAYQGEPGSNSHIACLEVLPDHEAIGFTTFEQCFQAVQQEKIKRAMIPIENALAGRVPDIHHLLPDSGLFITREHFQPIEFCLASISGAHLGSVQCVETHPMAFGQVGNFLRNHNFQLIRNADTAGAAKDVALAGDATRAAICSPFAARMHELEILAENIQDQSWNMTRFVVLAREAENPPEVQDETITAIVFATRNVPSALYKCLGGFASNGMNMTKLESYQLDGLFSATQFYAEVQAHPDSEAFRHADEELRFFCAKRDIIGAFRAHPYRRKIGNDVNRKGQ